MYSIGMGNGESPNIVVLNYDNIKNTYTTLISNQKKQDIASIFQSTDLCKALAEAYDDITFVSYKTQSLGPGLGSLGFLSLEMYNTSSKDEIHQTLSDIFGIPVANITITDTDTSSQYTIRTGPNNILYLKVNKTSKANPTLIDNTVVKSNSPNNNTLTLKHTNGQVHTNGLEEPVDDTMEKDRSNIHVVQDYLLQKLQRFVSIGEIQTAPIRGNKKSISLMVPVEDPYESALTDDILAELGISRKDTSIIDEVGGKRMIRYTKQAGANKMRIFVYLLSESGMEKYEDSLITSPTTAVIKRKKSPRYKESDTHIGEHSIFGDKSEEKRMAGQIPTSKVHYTDYFTIGGFGDTRRPGDNDKQGKSLAQAIGDNISRIKKENIREALMGGMSGPHRLNPFAKIGNVHYINDSASTRLHTAWYSLQSLPGPIVWIVGGIDHGGDTDDVFKDIPKDKVHSIINIGADTTFFDKIKKTLQGSVHTFFSARNMEEVVMLCNRLTQSGQCNDIKTVLLSPGCASFDLFQDYEDRGRKFMHAVRDHS